MRFGTDGIRGPAGHTPIDADGAEAVAALAGVDTGSAANADALDVKGWPPFNVALDVQREPLEDAGAIVPERVEAVGALDGAAQRAHQDGQQRPWGQLASLVCPSESWDRLRVE